MSNKIMAQQQEKIVKIKDQYYIAAESTYADDRVKILNHADTFGIFDRWGDIQPIGLHVQGIYYEDTRYLSAFELLINGQRPLLLSSTLKEENEILSADLANPDIWKNDEIIIPKGEIYIFRSKFIMQGRCYEKIKLVNHGTELRDIEISFTLENDFKDIFEVRGVKRPRKGEIKAPKFEHGHIVTLSYTGLDNIIRNTEINFSPNPDSFNNNEVIYKIKLGYVFLIDISFNFIKEKETGKPLSFNEAFNEFTPELKGLNERIADISTSNAEFNHWVRRSRADLVSLTARTPHGNYFYAGVPWYNTAFGRDGIITAYETLWAAPIFAKDVLLYLVKTQAKENEPYKDAEPGKIFHETRKGEMAEIGEVPFKLYYGTVDATPLFIMLAWAYYQRTADLETIKNIWPNILAALGWIEKYGDIDGDGFVEYIHKTASGLTNQGWKDSIDSVSHDNGNLAIPPIALCEVQGYVYDAKKSAAKLAEALGYKELGEKLIKDAESLKENFNKTFWDEDLGTFVLALDGNKRPCRVNSSNAGQCLFTGIVDEKYAGKLAEALLSEEMFTGWGIRTLGRNSFRYNPMSYHNGSVWPHDTALIAYGLSRYGYQEEALKILQGLFDASLFIDLQRLPELFCGFERRQGEGPTAYPVACSPQAWSVAAVYLLLKTCLRLEIDATKKEMYFHHPIMPAFLDTISINNLVIGDTRIMIDLNRYKNDVGINVLEKEDPEWKVVIYK
ncbi:amylo-alpha-1,6-glucosidase [Chitinophagaceae bacterium LB-8]|uniref:Amylo-alpha-1,6-glucosidase n=1 Tax=Paraflavisolibacter caeni TaxID=2982496 RepID=A0A9X2XYY7_9BACT|nr:amylo-alpha-1,6-glucosidase [Paraflavisolibacter caeni]MCU7551775.1 amylo-alpha-1,6-glucosidase [Paraflavisolibacter caeni]